MGTGDVCFEFSASLRIFGKELDFDDVSKQLNLTPSDVRRRGEGVGVDLPSKIDMWCYTVPVDRERPLGDHISALWDAIRPHIPYLKLLKQRYTVDVFCGYISDSDIAGFEIDQQSLGLFLELDVPLQVSVIVG